MPPLLILSGMGVDTTAGAMAEATGDTLAVATIATQAAATTMDVATESW